MKHKKEKKGKRETKERRYATQATKQGETTDAKYQEQRGKKPADEQPKYQPDTAPQWDWLCQSKNPNFPVSQIQYNVSP